MTDIFKNKVMEGKTLNSKNNFINEKKTVSGNITNVCVNTPVESLFLYITKNMYANNSVS